MYSFYEAVYISQRPPRITRTPQTLLKIIAPRERSFQFIYRWTTSVNVPANTITEQWPRPYTSNSATPYNKFVCATLNVTPRIGAIYAKVQGPTATPKISPRINAANNPLFLIFTCPGADHGIEITSIRYKPTTKNIPATK